jgi:short-subunit dehydrogenase
MNGKALLIGNTDGIGLAVTRKLLERGWDVVGISRSESPLRNPSYAHIVANVQSLEYPAALKSAMESVAPIDLCAYFAGIGEMLDVTRMESEVEILEVNLVGMVKTAALVIPLMVKRGCGHFIGISSLADEMLSPEAPSYNASKAGFSNYLEGLALALRSRGVHVTNIRFGFVDTKMAKGNRKPFLMDVDRAARHVISCVEKKPARTTVPWTVVPLVKLRKWMLRWSL